MFQQCTNDPLPIMQELLTTLKRLFVREFVAAKGESMEQAAEQRFDMAAKLYFKNLEALLYRVCNNTLIIIQHICNVNPSLRSLSAIVRCYIKTDEIMLCCQLGALLFVSTNTQ